MKYFKNIFKKKRICETPICYNELPEEPWTLMIDDHKFTVCDECAKIIEHMQNKMEESLDDESL